MADLMLPGVPDSVVTFWVEGGRIHMALDGVELLYCAGTNTFVAWTTPVDAEDPPTGNCNRVTYELTFDCAPCATCLETCNG